MDKIQITNTSVIELIQGALPEATVNEKGLLPAGKFGNRNQGSSTLLCTTNPTAITASMLLSISATTSGVPNLYFITIGRGASSTANPTLRVKVLSGSYGIKIKAKTATDGVCKIYAERQEYTPVLDVILLSKVGVTLNMKAADNSEFEDGFEATLI